MFVTIHISQCSEERCIWGNIGCVLQILHKRWCQLIRSKWCHHGSGSRIRANVFLLTSSTVLKPNLDGGRMESDIVHFELLKWFHNTSLLFSNRTQSIICAWNMSICACPSSKGSTGSSQLAVHVHLNCLCTDRQNMSGWTWESFSRVILLLLLWEFILTQFLNLK